MHLHPRIQFNFFVANNARDLAGAMTPEAILKENPASHVFKIPPLESEASDGDALEIAKLLLTLRAPGWSQDMYSANMLTDFLRATRYQNQRFVIPE